MYQLFYLFIMLFLCKIFFGPAGLAIIVGVAVFCAVMVIGNKYYGKR